MMDLGQCKEQFSIAHARAVASAAGFACHEPTVDDDSVDLTIAGRGGNGTFRSPRLDIQLKCTSDKNCLKPNYLHFPLKKKNYLDLQGTDFYVPRILVVMYVPEDINNWLAQTHHELRMHHCSYWFSLRHFPHMSTATKTTIQIPRVNIFDVQTLRNMMTTIANGGAP